MSCCELSRLAPAAHVDRVAASCGALHRRQSAAYGFGCGDHDKRAPMSTKKAVDAIVSGAIMGTYVMDSGAGNGSIDAPVRIHLEVVRPLVRGGDVPHCTIDARLVTGRVAGRWTPTIAPCGLAADHCPVEPVTACDV
jgi:hypothetical protein